MANLATLIPGIVIPRSPPLVPTPSQPSTAPYAPMNAPPRRHVPYWILHDPSLADSMMTRLRAYLPTAQGGLMPPSPQLQTHLAYLQITHTQELYDEATTATFWQSDIFPTVQAAVMEVDQNPTLPAVARHTTLYGQTPDGLATHRGAAPCLRLEHKSWQVFDAFAPDILLLAQHVEGGQLGTSLELRDFETDARSIIIRMGVSMIGREATSTPIPYGLLFGGDRFMFFSLFRNQDAIGEVRYGLACSDIISSTNAVTPLIPLTVYTLLADTNAPGHLCQPTVLPPIPIPPVLEAKKAVTRNRATEFAKNTFLRLTTSSASGAASRSFLFVREPDIFESVSSPVGSLASESSTVPVANPPLSSTDIDTEDRFPCLQRGPLDPFDDTEIEVSLREYIGYGASGEVFIGTTDLNDEKYAVKIATTKDGKQMLEREAEMYEILSDLQGLCIPKIYGFFSSEHRKALVMTYMGQTVETIESELSIHQRHQLLEELCLIHEGGVVHGDVRGPNIVFQNGCAHLIDFSHGREHQCVGRDKCPELVEARRVLKIQDSLQTGTVYLVSM